MSIEERRNEVVEFRLGGSARSVLRLPDITVENGQVHTMGQIFTASAHLDEYIEALRLAAKAANLPEGPEEAKSA